MTAAPNGESADLVALSLEIEAATGYDSIPTIERVYDRTDSGAILCCFPCRFRRKSAADLWHHVHLSGTHKRTSDLDPWLPRIEAASGRPTDG